MRWLFEHRPPCLVVDGRSLVCFWTDCGASRDVFGACPAVARHEQPLFHQVLRRDRRRSGHDVSILKAVPLRRDMVLPNTSTTTMRPPQQGHGTSGGVGGSASLARG